MGAQVTVLASRVSDGRPRFQQAGMGMTNDLGEYRIANLPRGKYILCVHLNQPNGLCRRRPRPSPADTCYPGPLEGGVASAMELPAGRESKVDFTLNEVLPVHVRGAITGLPEGPGIRGQSRQAGRQFRFRREPARRRSDGKFDFRVPPGSYMLTSDYFEAGKRLTARVPVDAGSSDIDNVVVHLDSGFTVTGIVRVVSQSGQNCRTQQFGINLRPSEPVNGTGQLKWEPDHTSFAINDMVPGSYRLDVNPPAPFYVKSATLAGQDILNTEVPISQAAGPIEIVLRDDGGSIEGDVVDANGQPVAAGIMLLRDTIRAANADVSAERPFQTAECGAGRLHDLCLGRTERSGICGSGLDAPQRGRWHRRYRDRGPEPADQADPATGSSGIVRSKQPQPPADAAPDRARQPLVIWDAVSDPAIPP